MLKVFINYRRQDAASYAQLLWDRLTAEFGRENVFKDVDSIEIGEPWDVAIEKWVGKSNVFLAVIGRSWVDSADRSGDRRLDNPNDPVRLEIAKALARKIRVIPLFVDGADEPRPEELPGDIRELMDRQGRELLVRHWQTCVDQLVTDLHRVKPDPGQLPPPEPKKQDTAGFPPPQTTKATAPVSDASRPEVDLSKLAPPTSRAPASAKRRKLWIKPVRRPQPDLSKLPPPPPPES